MGCGGSKASVAPQQSREAWQPQPTSSGEHPTPTRTAGDVKADPLEETLDSTSTLTDGGEVVPNRNISAKSLKSTATMDSGLGDDDNTEKTDSTRAIRDASIPTQAHIQTTQITSLPGNTEKDTNTSKLNSNNKLSTDTNTPSTTSPSNQCPGPTSELTVRPQSRSAVAFKVDLGVHSSGSNIKGGGGGEGVVVGRVPPSLLRKLEQHRREQATKEELEEKQRAARHRRKELEQQLVERIHARKEKEQRMCEAMQAFIQQQQGQGTHGKMEAAASENREAYLKGLRNKLREKGGLEGRERALAHAS